MSACPSATAAAWLPSGETAISGNSVNQGDIFVGGEHNRPLELEHFENGQVFIDSEGRVIKIGYLFVDICLGAAYIGDDTVRSDQRL